MNKLNLNQMLISIEHELKKNAPCILTGIGIAGMITTVALAIKDTPKALYLIETKKADEELDELKPIEVVKTCWKCYVPAFVTCSLSVACLIGSNTVSARRTTALGAAYSLSEAALREYREKVIETIGEKKEQQVQEAIAKDHMKKNPVTSNEVIVMNNKYGSLCYDRLSSRYFNSDIETIKSTINKLNYEMIQEMSVSLNDFYYGIGLPPTDIGDNLFWFIDNGLIDVSFSSQLADDGRPCIVINFNNNPKYDNRRI